MTRWLRGHVTGSGRPKACDPRTYKYWRWAYRRDDAPPPRDSGTGDGLKRHNTEPVVVTRTWRPSESLSLYGFVAGLSVRSFASVRGMWMVSRKLVLVCRFGSTTNFRGHRHVH